MRKLGRFWQHQGGVTAIEYGLIAGLIALAIFASMSRVFAKVMTSLLTAAS